MVTQYGRRFLDMGVCNSINTGKFSRCAWEKDECDNSTQIFVAHEQSNESRRNCNPSDQPVGRCLSEDQCSLRSSDCQFNTTFANFKPYDSTCTIQRDKALEWDVENPAFTQFGSCLDTTTNEYFCIYYPSDCEDSSSEVYVNPTDTLAAGVTCDCSQVHVTGCIGDTAGYCALNENGCREDEVAFSPYAQKSDREGTGIDCRLCRKRNTMTPTPAPTTKLKPTPYPTINLTPRPTYFMPVARPIQSHSSSQKAASPRTGEMDYIIAPIIVGVCCVCFLGLVYLKLFSDATKKNKKKEIDVNPPPLQIAFSIEDSDSISVDSSVGMSVGDIEDKVNKKEDEWRDDA